jgi:hypothetical protein
LGIALGKGHNLLAIRFPPYEHGNDWGQSDKSLTHFASTTYGFIEKAKVILATQNIRAGGKKLGRISRPNYSASGWGFLAVRVFRGEPFTETNRLKNEIAGNGRLTLAREQSQLI